jgi:hypothetical protein
MFMPDPPDGEGEAAGAEDPEDAEDEELFDREAADVLGVLP